jgi:hypothetical protein
MPEQSRYPNESQEHYKQRIKKLKARTSKMKLAVVKKKKKEYDQDAENEHNRDNYNAQSSVETGGDY